MAGQIAPDNAKRRRELQALYVASIESDGIAAVHRLLSEAMIEARRRRARAVPKRQPTAAPAQSATMMWRGQSIELGPAMTALNASRRLYVLHFVRGEMTAKDAAKAAGYRSKASSKGLKACRRVRDAVAEEQSRDE